MVTKKKPAPHKISQAGLKQALGDSDDFRFRCTECGKCCIGPGEVYFSEDDLENIYNYLALETNKEKEDLQRTISQSREHGLHVHSAGTACHFLSRENRCTIYPVRPLQCRRFPFWPSTFESK